MWHGRTTRVTEGSFVQGMNSSMCLISPTATAMIGSKKTLGVKEALNMMANSASETLSVRLWRMVYEAYTRFSNAMDQTLGEQGFSSEQYWVLLILKYTDTPPRIVDMARWLERSPNSISNLIDRMVKAGLLRRVRDRGDRRVVNVFMTSKAENSLQPAARAVWELMQQCMSPLSYEDKTTFAGLFNVIHYKLLGHLNPGVDIEGMSKNASKWHDHLLKQWRKHARPGITEAKGRGVKKGKAT